MQTAILNWTGSEMKIEVYKPDGIFYMEGSKTRFPQLQFKFQIPIKVNGNLTQWLLIYLTTSILFP